MDSAAQWRIHFRRRIRSLDGHTMYSKHSGRYPGVLESLVGYLAEVCPPGSLERVASALRFTVFTFPDSMDSGVTREVPTDFEAVQATLYRANVWLRQVRLGRTAGVDLRVLADQETAAIVQSSASMAAGLLTLAPPAAVEGLQLAVRPRLLQSEKFKELNFALRVAMSRADAVAALFDA